MDTTLAQNFLQDDYALFQGHTLTPYHAANFIGHLDRPPIVGDEQDAQDRFESSTRCAHIGSVCAAAMYLRWLRTLFMKSSTM
jgi:hypothetical protein